ncbi:MAG: YlxM family DNA-binding protein [Syntrophaceticus sp.]
MNLKKFERMALLSDFYCELLTARQQEVIRYYYEHDLSLGEIAENLNISRQAVHDILKRAEKALENYELKLGLLADYLKERKSVDPEEGR